VDHRHATGRHSHGNPLHSGIVNARGCGPWGRRDRRSSRSGKTPVYTVSEIQITNLDAYLKEFAPVAQASIRSAGGTFIAGGPGTSFEGAPPATRITIQKWDSLEQAKAWRNGADYRKAREIGDKYAKFRAMAVEGSPQ
jgi:uncharacterized protein (DUF1330 family)